MDIRGDQHPHLLTQQRSALVLLGMPLPLAQPCDLLCPAYLVLHIEVCSTVLQQFDSIQVPTPAGPVHGRAVQLDIQCCVMVGDTPTLCLSPAPAGPRVGAELAEPCLQPP